MSNLRNIINLAKQRYVRITCYIPIQEPKHLFAFYLALFVKARRFEPIRNPKFFISSTLIFVGIMMKKRKVMIILTLLDESREKTNEEIEEEIREELSCTNFPWCAETEKVKIIEE